ncbi:MAG: tetratricopeptide repeat protein, partial [Candidatus Thorarchaeota archaeon]
MSSVKKLREEGKIKEALQVVLELEQGKDLSLKELLSYKLVKADLLRLLWNYLDAIEIAKEIFQEFQKQGDLVSSFDALLIQAYCYTMMANLSKSEDTIKQSEVFLQNIKQTLVIDLRERESQFLRIKANSVSFKGEVSQSLKLTKKAYELAKDIGNKGLICASLNNIADKYYQMQEYDKAIRYAKQALKVNDPSILGFLLGTLIEIYLSKGNIKKAKVYLDHLHDYSD